MDEQEVKETSVEIVEDVKIAAKAALTSLEHFWERVGAWLNRE